MKKLLLILFCLPVVVLAQQTYVPDDNFEAYLESNGMGNGVPNDDYVTTANINSVTTLDVGFQNISDLTGIEGFSALEWLECCGIQVTSLDLSQNTNLIYLFSHSNQLLTSLDLRNGNNINFLELQAGGCPNLSCIDVDDVNWSTSNWTAANYNIDTTMFFSTNCHSTSIQEHSTNKELLKVINILGRETNQTNQPLLYIYDDGTVEKRIVVE